MPLLPILSPEESGAWDLRAVKEGIALATLMDAAGRAAAVVLLRDFPHEARQGVLVATGTGHNGGDGWVLARALHRLDVPVWVASLAGEMAPLTEQVAKQARIAGVREVAPDGPWPAVGIVVDAILGTGAKGALRPAAQALSERLLDLELPIVAIDAPSGLDLGSGIVHGTARADLTITFGGPRRGHLLARDEVGDLVVVDIGHSPVGGGLPLLLSDQFAALRLPRLHASDHKGSRGRVVVVGGDSGMSGAARLAGRAAFAAGAGLVHVTSSAESIAAIRAAEPDLQTLEHRLVGAVGDELMALIERADALVIGPGLGRSPEKTDFVLACIAAAKRIIVDADALVALQGRTADLATLGQDRVIVLTPHAGEFRTLFPSLAAGREADPWSAASEASIASGTTVLLKGVPTVVASGDRPMLTIAAGNPGLATGGSGDVLSGIIGALLAHELAGDLAAAIGAQALGRAADLAARRVTARAMRPMDVITALADLWREWDALLRTGTLVESPVLLRLPRPRTV
jgi:ADP-dependent NAD(P)H-hydrate dehydratase / NAD(P)H-hydrate epimerase